VRFGLVVFGVLGFFYQGSVATWAGSIEVVQTVPIETQLAVKGIRSTQEVWVEMIQAAKHSIHLEQFYVCGKIGESLDPVLASLKDAAARGVQVRLLLDSKFFKNYTEIPTALSKVDNIQVKIIDFSSTDGVQHSKFFVVDDAESFVGSANFDWLALSHIHEVGLRVSDKKASSDLELVFAKDWQRGKALVDHSDTDSDSNEDDMNTQAVSDFHVIASPPVLSPSGVPDTLVEISRLLSSAQKSIRIQMYEYTTKVYGGGGRWTALDAVIRKAAARGVHVQLMVDAMSLKTGRQDLKGLADLDNIEVKIVTIPQWSGGPIPYSRLIHSKYFVVDGTSAWVGTENWSKNYFTASRNVGLSLTVPESVQNLNRIFDQVWNSAYTSTKLDGKTDRR
jgi:phosphatidylserine/phosphatidylglycerophosphate/cardiolipin synthase-like enzyme